MSDDMPTFEERAKLCEAEVTLDGEPAKVSGYRLPFAQVRRKDGKGGAVEFAWPTVAHVVANRDGAFLS